MSIRLGSSALSATGPAEGSEKTAGVYTIATLRLVIAIAAFAAIAYELAEGLPRDESVGDYFSFFTVLSNIFAAAIFLAGALRPRGTMRSSTMESLRGAAVVYILTTGIVYAVLLSGKHVAYPWANDVLHRAMPVAVVLDWVIDPPRVRLAPLRAIVLWMAFPLAYVAYTLIRGAIVGWYPYFFVSPHRPGGYALVAGDCLAVAAGIVALIAATTWAGNRRGAALTA